MKILTQCLPFLVALVFSSGVTYTFNELYGKKVPNRVVQSRLSEPKFSCNRVIPMIIFYVPPHIHTLNPESRPDFAFKSRISNSK